MKIMCMINLCLNFKPMCEHCNTSQKKKFVDKAINTEDYDRIIFIGQKVEISGAEFQQNKNDLFVKSGGAGHKAAQMLSSIFISEPRLLELFELAKELIPIMKSNKV